VEFPTCLIVNWVSPTAARFDPALGGALEGPLPRFAARSDWARSRAIEAIRQRVEDLAKSEGLAVIAGIEAFASLRKEADLHTS
jgi:hypothetical protein